MASSTWRFGFPLAIALATASAAAVAQQTIRRGREHMRHVSAIAKGAAASGQRGSRLSVEHGRYPLRDESDGGGLERPQGTIECAHPRHDPQPE